MNQLKVSPAYIPTSGGGKWCLVTDENRVLTYTPRWRTKNGAIRWALKRGHEVKEVPDDRH